MRLTRRSRRPTEAEIAAVLPGDDLLPDAQVVMDRAGTLPAPAATVWPWLVQLGKDRAGWYLPRIVERLVPRRHRALRAIDERWQHLSMGQTIPDYGFGEPEFLVRHVQPPAVLVYITVRRNRRGAVTASWALVLTDGPDGPDGGGARSCRLQLRLRLAGLRRPGLARIVGGAFDALTTAAMLAGLRERVNSGLIGA